MNWLDKLEHSIGSAFSKLGPPKGGAGLEIAELRRAIVREIADRVEPRGRGEYIFAYTAVEVELYAGDPERRDVLDAALGGDALQADIQEALRERGVSAAPDVRVSATDNVEMAAVAPYKITWLRQGAHVKGRSRPAARLTVIRGQADVERLAIERDRIYLGRMKEIVDAKVGLKRRNDLAFDASETTVARRHAVLIYEPSSAAFRLMNDPSNQSGTVVFRDGAAIRCDSTRGVQLRSGDEIHLGTARVGFEIDARDGEAGSAAG